MPKNRAVGVTPKPAYHDYVDENLKVVEYDSDQMLPGCEAEFYAGANMAEGASGLKPIDTTYENTSEDFVECPRSDTAEFVATNRHRAPYDIRANRYPQRRI